MENTIAPVNGLYKRLPVQLQTYGLGGLVVSAPTFIRDIVGSNPAGVEIIFRPLVRLAHTRRALGWV